MHFALAAGFLTTAVWAQLQQTCMIVDGGFINSSTGGFVQMADGGYASAGSYAETNDGYSAIGVTRFDANGSLVWMRSWSNGPNQGAVAQGLVATPDGGLVLVGWENATLNSGLYILKLDASGTMEWAKTYTSPDFALLSSFYSDGFIQTSDGGFALIAFKEFPDHSYCMFRTDANGDLLWSDEIRYTGVPSDVAELPNGDLIFTGWKNGQLAPQLTLRKDGLTGTTEWMHWYNSTTDEIDVHGVTIGPDSTIVLVGRCYVPMAGNWGHMGAMALDAQGTPLWMTKVWTSDDVKGYQVTPHPDGGYVIVGTATEAFPGLDDIAPCIIKLDDNGQLEWSKRYPHPDLLYSWFTRVAVADDGDLLVSGQAVAATNYPQRLMKLAPDGSTCPYCPSADSGSYLALDPQIAPDQGFMAAGPWAVEAMLTLTMTDHTAAVLADMCGTTGIADIANGYRVSLSPNPMIDNATLLLPEGPVPGNTVFELLDPTGRSVRAHRVSSTTVTIARGDLAAGSYLFRIGSDRGIIAVGKVQVADR